MKKNTAGRHRSIFQKHLLILLVSVTIIFLGGIGLVLASARQNWAYIRQLLENNLTMSVAQMEDRIEAVEQLSYDIITDGGLQAAGSALLACLDDRETYTAYDKSLAINELTAAIRTKVEGHNNIVSANYISPEGIQYTISNTLYVRPDEAMMGAIDAAARERSGSQVHLHFPEEAGYGDYLIIARQIREKQGQTLRDIGVVYLIADMRRITELYRRSNGYGLIIEDGAGSPLFTFMDALDTGLTGEEVAGTDWRQSYLRTGGEVFAVAVMSSAGSQYRYRVVSAITQVYKNFERSVVLVILLYSAVVVVILAAAMLSTRSVTNQLMKLVDYIQTTPTHTQPTAQGGGYTQVTPHPLKGINTSEVIALKDAYDDMLLRINSLVQNNYTQMLLVKEAEISALQAQFNPHFLYNTLNSVYWMAKTAGNAEVMAVTRSLSTLMREAISSRHYVVPLEKELAILDHYLTIQRQRYDGRFALELQVRTGFLNSAVPKFTLQPLLENAFTHGVENMLETCRITVEVYDEGETLVCEVCNTGPDIDEAIMEKLQDNTVQPKGNGVGLLNIDYRIKSLFGQQYGITVHNHPRRGAVVRAVLARIPMEEYELHKTEGQHG